MVKKKEIVLDSDKTEEIKKEEVIDEEVKETPHPIGFVSP